jgi:dTDP-4-amino-4,6-dideoxygalactose transaminase
VIPLFKPYIPQAAATVIDQVLQSGQISGDGRLPEFEAKLRNFLGARYLAATGEFSRSMEMAFRMAGITPGDSVLVSPLACLATTQPILQAGARPVWCDIDTATGGIRADELARRRTDRTKAVLLYHWVGIPGDITGILNAAQSLELKVIEDAGEALGAEYDGKRIGTHGCDYSVFSFSPARHMTTIEGAAITFREAGEHANALAWRRFGIPDNGFRDELGEIRHQCDIATPGLHNYMNRVAGALGVLQLECLPRILETYRQNGAFYNQRLSGVPGIRLLSGREGSVPSYWVYSFLCERRGDLRRKLREAGIFASTVHIRNDSYTCFGGAPSDLPGVTGFERQQLSIPCGWWLSEEDKQHIVSTISSGW